MVTEIWVTIYSGNGLVPTAPSHYPNQCWLLISEVLWPSGNFTKNAKNIDPRYEFETYQLTLSQHLPRTDYLLETHPVHLSWNVFYFRCARARVLGIGAHSMASSMPPHKCLDKGISIANKVFPKRYQYRHYIFSIYSTMPLLYRLPSKHSGCLNAIQVTMITSLHIITKQSMWKGAC